MNPDMELEAVAAEQIEVLLRSISSSPRIPTNTRIVETNTALFHWGSDARKQQTGHSLQSSDLSCHVHWLNDLQAQAESQTGLIPDRICKTQLQTGRAASHDQQYAQHGH